MPVLSWVRTELIPKIFKYSSKYVYDHHTISRGFWLGNQGVWAGMGAPRGWRGSVWGPGQAGHSLVIGRFTQKQVEFKEEIAAH